MVFGYLVTVFGMTGFFIWLFYYLFISHQEKGEKFIEWFSKLLSWTGKKAQKVATAKNIQNKINSFVDSINTEVKNLLPYGLKIKWISPEISRESFIQNDRVIVMLNFHRNQDENLSKATLLYMEKAVIPEARPHIHKRLSEAIDLMMTKKALYSFIEARSCLNHYIDTVLRPATENNSDVKEFCNVIDIIDEKGLFSRMLLRELSELGIKRSGVTETGETVHETNEFAKKLVDLAEKEKDVDINPNFIKNHIRVAVILVARSYNVDNHGVYLKKIKFFIDKSVNTFYVFARGKINISFTKEVVAMTQKKFSQLSLVHEEEYPTKIQSGKIMPGYCAILYNRKTI